MGGELNSEIEHQTARDSTVGPDKPLGTRGAVMADTVGAARTSRSVALHPDGYEIRGPKQSAPQSKFE